MGTAERDPQFEATTGSGADDSFRRERERLIGTRLRTALIIALIAVGPITFSQVFLFPLQKNLVIASAVAQIGGLLVALFAIGRFANFARLRIVALAAMVWIIACSALTVARLDELGSFAGALICLQFGMALLIPWGLSAQILSSLAAVLAYLAAMALSGRYDIGNAAGLVWICCGGALAAAATYILERSRRALFHHRARDREIISSFAHDIRAPASAISMQTELVDELAQDAEMRSAMQAIRASATQVLNLAQNMVDSIRIEEGEMALRVETVNLNNLLKETVLEQESLARVKGIEIALDLMSELGTIQSDPLQLKRVIINLLTNGLSVTPSGGRVVLSTGLTSKLVRISVKDGGPGLAPEERDQLFERFTGLARSRGGIGLGLSIAKDIVARCGGRIEVESAPGRGSIFSVLLPRLTPT